MTSIHAQKGYVSFHQLMLWKVHDPAEAGILPAVSKQYSVLILPCRLDWIKANQCVLQNPGKLSPPQKQRRNCRICGTVYSGQVRVQEWKWLQIEFSQHLRSYRRKCQQGEGGGQCADRTCAHFFPPNHTLVYPFRAYRLVHLDTSPWWISFPTRDQYVHVSGAASQSEDFSCLPAM